MEHALQTAACLCGTIFVTASFLPPAIAHDLHLDPPIEAPDLPAALAFSSGGGGVSMSASSTSWTILHPPQT